MPLNTSPVKSTAAAASKDVDRRDFVSVIIPVRNSAESLEAVLRALSASTYPSFEVIVVDDASTDETADIAQRSGVTVVRREQQGGPAAARNDGARASRGTLLLFVDADVIVQSETIEQFVETFQQSFDVAAVFGSYDAQPASPRIVSQYRNLMHHFVHQQGNDSASTFWAGCGAIRREIFFTLGGFNSGYGAPSIEDIELGVRMRASGFAVRLEKSLQVKHLKHWSPFDVLRTDVFRRAIPWTRLILRERDLPNDLNLKWTDRISAILAWLAVASSFFALPVLLFFVTCLGLVLAVDTLGTSRIRRSLSQLFAVVLIGLTGSFACYAAGLAAAVPLVALAGEVALNARFYHFLIQVRGPLFAFLAVPLHVSYLLYSAGSFGVGMALHLLCDRRAVVSNDAGFANVVSGTKASS